MPEQEGQVSASAVDATATDRSGIAGHPRGLTTLFFTEFWERFSYYGMRALLVLFMTDSRRGGLGFPVSKAAGLYGLYTAAVYLVALPGGWVADRILGQRRAVLIGGIIIAAGHFSLAVVGLPFFYTGLILIVIGTGLLKPNISTMVGQLYAEEDVRRDAGFSIFYMGINLGAFFSPLVCGTLGEVYSWHWGFAAAGVGMLFGLLQYVLGGARLGQAGLHPSKPEKQADSSGSPLMSSGLWIAGLVLVFSAFLVDFSHLGRLLLLAGGSTLFIIALYWGGNFTRAEKNRGIAIYVLFWVAALFWSAFEQAGSSLTLFAERMTERTVGSTIAAVLPADAGGEFPATWFQSLNPLYILLLAPVFAWLWVSLGKREPSSPLKFAYALVLVGAGFAVMVGAAIVSGGEDGTLVSPLWLASTYLLHTLGELCLSPVGLSLMTKLAPPRIAGQIMGVWFLAAAVGNFMGGQIAGFFEAMPLPELFTWVCVVNIAAGLVLAAFSKPIRKLMEGVH